MKGTLEAADGIFSGQLQAATGTFSGNLSAASGSFSGDITGSTGTFTGVVKASDFLDANGNSMMDNGKFDSSYLDLGNITLNGTTGDITLGGNIYITGNIQWNSSNSPVSVQYSSDGVSNWHTTYYTTDYFARYSYDGGSTWTQAVKIQGVDGHNGSDANVTYQNVFNALTNNGTMRGIFYGYNPETGGDQGALYINADYIKTGTLNAMHIVLGDSTAMPVTIYEYYPIYTNWGYQWQYGAHSVPQYGLRIGYGSDGRNDSYGPQMYYCFLNMASLYELRSQVICTEYGAALKFSSEYVCATATGCYASTAFVYGSDSRIKHDIDYDMDAYESFFNKLRPCHFIFNSSSDESKDIGFITQDVETALTESGMTTREFAGLKIEDTSEYKDFHGLRYDDFIALNTYMIQKLYKRIEALEDEIKNIKEKA